LAGFELICMMSQTVTMAKLGAPAVRKVIAALFPRTALCFAEPSDITTLKESLGKSEEPKNLLLILEALRANLLKKFRRDDLYGDAFKILFD